MNDGPVVSVGHLDLPDETWPPSDPGQCLVQGWHQDVVFRCWWWGVMWNVYLERGKMSWRQCPDKLLGDKGGGTKGERERRQPKDYYDKMLKIKNKNSEGSSSSIICTIEITTNTRGECLWANTELSLAKIFLDILPKLFFPNWCVNKIETWAINLLKDVLLESAPPPLWR